MEIWPERYEDCSALSAPLIEQSARYLYNLRNKIPLLGEGKKGKISHFFAKSSLCLFGFIFKQRIIIAHFCTFVKTPCQKPRIIL